MKRALMIVGHGSRVNPDTARPVYNHLRRLSRDAEARRLFHEFGAAFWKEEPFLTDAVRSIDAHEVVVVPMLMAAGYFSETVVPRELGLDDQSLSPTFATQRVLYAEPVGTHPEMTRIVTGAIRRILPRSVDRRAAHVVLVGHGTKRNPASAAAVLDQVQQLSVSHEFASVAPAFIDDEPNIADLWQQSVYDGETVVVVPYFVADGDHTRVDIPRLLGFEAPADASLSVNVADRTVFYTRAIGTENDVSELVLARARQALEAEEQQVQTRPTLAAQAHRAFREWASVGGRFGQLQITRRQFPWELRHHVDSLRGDLEWHEGPWDAVDIARLTEEGDLRPLRTADDLRRGWQLGLSGADAFRRALDILYPGAVVNWFLARTEQLDTVPFEETAARQTGIYRKLADAPSATVKTGIASVCQSRCVRQRMWSYEGDEPHPASVEDGEIPCREACPVLWEKVRR